MLTVKSYTSATSTSRAAGLSSHSTGAPSTSVKRMRSKSYWNGNWNGKNQYGKKRWIRDG